VGRAAGTLAEAPSIAAEPGDDDHRLVAAVRRGDDRAFEALYLRYQRRITSYVLSMVKDHGRAEDVTQEVFVSALRRMRETERPIAFKPWIYEIAKNACIDQFRRSQRGEEVSFDADETLVPGRLVGAGQTPDAAVFAKQELDNLCGAFDGLSDTHHEILVLRELEGMSYREIGERMGMSRPAVESTLFRARRRLTEEFDDLATGARCQRIHGIIATAIEGSLGARETRQLARHIAHCQPCRREALAAGVDSSILTHVPLRRRAAEKIAALLPFPALARFLRGRGGGDEAASAVGGPPGGAWAAHAPMLSDHFNAGWSKAAAAAALLLAGVGATGVGTKLITDRNDPPPPAQTRPATQPRGGADTTTGGSSTAGGTSGGAAQNRAARRENGGRSDRNASDRTRRDARDRAAQGGDRDGGGATTPAGSQGGGGGASGGGNTADNPNGSAKSGGGGGSGGGGSGDGTTTLPSTPDLPGTGGQALNPVVDGVGNTVNNTVDGLNQTVNGATQGVGETLNGVSQTLQGSDQGLTNTVNGVENTVNNTVAGLDQTLGGAKQGLEETLNGVGGLLRPPGN
jgi:RNA polymerase sigma factor (sigma-70 family)